MATWPTTLLNEPTLSFSFSNEVPVNRTRMSSGKVRQVRLSTTSIKYMSVEFTLDDTQMGAFESWIRFKINFGMDWFTMPIKMGNGKQNRLVRFIEGRYSSSYEEGRWRCTAQLECENPIIMDEATLDALLA